AEMCLLEIYEDVVYHDLSLTEIAAENGISRQGVHDMIRRCNRILQEYENKLHLVARFMRIRENVLKLEEMSGDTGLTREEIIKQIKELSSRILEEL
ncbi:MAG: DNA-binding protein, partial [Lachnospiraceae bacterium]|nr:DNA-binding protein [Lachnospiraceae bacterium]